MRGIFSVLVKNRDGMLSQTAGLSACRDFNIDSLMVGKTEQYSASSMTTILNSDSRTLDQVKKRLNKKIGVIKMRRLEESSSISEGMMLIKVTHPVITRASLIEFYSTTDTEMVHFSRKTVVIQLTAEPEAILNFIELVRNYGILGVQRVGNIRVSRD